MKGTVEVGLHIFYIPSYASQPSNCSHVTGYNQSVHVFLNHQFLAIKLGQTILTPFANDGVYWLYSLFVLRATSLSMINASNIPSLGQELEHAPNRSLWGIIFPLLIRHYYSSHWQTIMLKLLPCDSKWLTTSGWPWSAAINKGVKPLFVCCSMLIPLFTSLSNVFTSPDPDAWCNAL